MTRHLQIVMALAPLLPLLGCYNTSSVENGGLACSSEGTCPTGFACQDGRCWQNAKQPLTCSQPFGPFASCTAQTPANSSCDPVCQSGCDCSHRCVYEADQTAFVCEATPAPASFVAPLANCDNRIDRCAPGSVCIADDICPSLCYKTCRADGDCPTNSRCTTTGLTDAAGAALVDGVYFCSPPTEACNPTGAAACAAARTGFNCVFVAGLTGSGTSDATVCDCATLHNVRVGEACVTTPDNCQPGAVCVNNRCRTICNKSASGSACPSGGGCNTLYGSRVYGYCQ
jgi:hypothetical protein